MENELVQVARLLGEAGLAIAALLARAELVLEERVVLGADYGEVVAHGLGWDLWAWGLFVGGFSYFCRRLLSVNHQCDGCSRVGCPVGLVPRVGGRIHCRRMTFINRGSCFEVELGCANAAGRVSSWWVAGFQAAPPDYGACRDWSWRCSCVAAFFWDGIGRSRFPTSSQSTRRTADNPQPPQPCSARSESQVR